MALRWGIISSGKISHDFVSAVNILPKSDHEIVAVAARTLASAETFAKTHGIPEAYGDYKKIAENKNIDVVYIGSVNSTHFEISKLMLEHGKPILCEKPWTLNEKQTRRLVQIARSKKVFAMEAIWSRCFPAYTQLQKLLADNVIGDIILVTVGFGADLKNVERLQTKELGGGTILDLGIYNAQFQQLVFKGEQPVKVLTDGTLNANGVDNGVNAILSFKNQRSAIISTSGRGALTNEAVIVGEKGIIRIPQFWCPTQLITPDKTYNFPLPETKAPFVFLNSQGLSYEAEHVRQCIKGGKLESPLITQDESIQLANLLDTLRKQIGFDFPEDSQEF